MPMRLSTIFRVPRILLRMMGYDIIRHSESVTDANARRLRALKEARIDVILDVGAAEGIYGDKLRQSGYSERIISFEPLSESYQKLRDRSRQDGEWIAVHAAIGDRDGEASINVSGRSTSSSLLPMASSHVAAAPDSAYVSREVIPIKRLDTVLAGLIRPHDRLYLKIDVQGYEEGVLAGATETLKSTHVVEVEVSMVQLYEGSILYAQMIEKLDALGFCLISWEDVFTDPESGYVLQSDCIFVRRS